MNHLGELTEKLKEKMDSRSQEVEQVTKNALKGLSENLLKYAESELNTITSDMDAHFQKLRKKQSRISTYHWKQNILANIISALFLIIILVSITGYLGWRIQAQNEELNQLKDSVVNLKTKERKLKNWGITMHQQGKQKFLAFPKGTNLEILKTSNGDPAVLLQR